ncbi:MAG: DUF3489 domain-containing protein [Alphaproteobacteria bacterium]
MAKLTDTQLVILSAASQRADGNLLPLPKSLKLNKAAASMVLQSLLKAKLAAEQPAEPGEPVWREDDDVKLTLKITESALSRLDRPASTASQEPTAAPSNKAAKPQKPAKSQKAPTKPKATKAPASAKPKMPAASGTKIDSLITLLSRKTGATIAEAMEATGWQAHSVRGAISSTLKKKHGLTVTSEVEGARGRVYRIAAGR